MHNIAYVLKKHSSVRVFFTVVISLAMAVLIGSGLHPTGAADQPVFSQPSPAAQQPATGTAPTVAAGTGATTISALDQALRNMGTLERDRNSANSAEVKLADGSSPTKAPVKSLADTGQGGNPAPPITIKPTPGK
jgi:hypothetical protein